MKKLNLSLAALAVAGAFSMPAQSAVLLGAKVGADGGTRMRKSTTFVPMTQVFSHLTTPLLNTLSR